MDTIFHLGQIKLAPPVAEVANIIKFRPADDFVVGQALTPTIGNPPNNAVDNGLPFVQDSTTFRVNDQIWVPTDDGWYYEYCCGATFMDASAITVVDLPKAIRAIRAKYTAMVNANYDNHTYDEEADISQIYHMIGKLQELETAGIVNFSTFGIPPFAKALRWTFEKTGFSSWDILYPDP